MTQLSKQLKRPGIFGAIAIIITLIPAMMSCGSNESSNVRETKKVETRPSKWSKDEINEVSKKYKGSDFQKYQVKRLIESIQYDQTAKEFVGDIKAGKVKEVIASQKVLAKDAMSYEFNVNEIAGKSPKAIEKVFGKPINLSTVRPSRTPCPCPKKEYLNGIIEIVYIKGKADWITINVNDRGLVSSDKYEVQRHGDYAYIKAFTP